MEFFERLYRGFEAEHYVAGKLFSAGYEAFKLPADFGFDLMVTIHSVLCNCAQLTQWLIGFAPDSELALDGIGHL